MVTLVKYSYILAGFVTFVVFSAGMFLQWNFDQLRTNDVLNRINDLELSTNSILVEKELVGFFNDTDCPALIIRTQDVSKKIEKLGGILESYKDSSMFQEAKYDDIKHEYILLEIFYWLKLLETKKECNTTGYVTMLNFYSEKCETCGDQGIVLTELKKKYKEKLLIFTIDTGFADRDTSINVIVSKYNVTASPTLVIDRDVKLVGFVPKDKLEEIILSRMSP